ncbi:MAG: PQQ-dependent sugar dehydrogenase [Patescibacteria group bacterium]|nr:PQQ-dependent sugar dehydrogenase [Patescibacteria group bacterium]
MNKSIRIILYILLLVVFISGMTYFYQYLTGLEFQPHPENPNIPSRTSTNNGNDTQSGKQAPQQETVAENLRVPWEIVFLPNGNILVTERPGAIVQISNDLTKRYEIANVEHIGEGGLLGMALHPDFDNNQWIYIYKTTLENGRLRNQVERYIFKDGFTDRFLILDDIPADANHNGGRIEFGPDGKLYVTTGDAGNGDLAQNTSSLAGKILRINDDGSIPNDNPFSNEVWSYGHRNPQGLAWDGNGRLWATEHGRSGFASGYDELNLIERGNNYGWPIIQGNETRQGMTTPVQHSGASNTWAPAGLTYHDNRLYFGGLRGTSIYVAHLNEQGGLITIAQHPKHDIGRIRAVKHGPDGYIYLTTSNTDGRGEPKQNDDKIFKYALENFIAADSY